MLKVKSSSPSATPSAAAMYNVSVVSISPAVKLKVTLGGGRAMKEVPVVPRRSDRLYAEPPLLKVSPRVPADSGPLNRTVNVTMSPSSTCRPGQVVSRSPPVPQFAGVPAQLPVAEMLTVWAAAGADANAAKARTRAASAKRRRAATPPEVRERRLPLAPPDSLGGGGGGTNSRVLNPFLHGPGHGNRSRSTGILKPYSLSFRACGELRGIWTPLVAIQT